MQQRYYDPAVGRFLSIDPVGASATTGFNFNRYWYAGNNPYRFTDPDGRFLDEATVVRLARATQVAIIADEVVPEPTDVIVVKHVVYAVVFVAAEGALYYYTQPDEPVTTVAPAVTPVEPTTPATPTTAAEHTKGARPSTRGKHEAGQSRRDRDRGGEKADSSRRPPSQRPPNHRGPWPPKPPEKPPEKPKKDKL